MPVTQEMKKLNKPKRPPSGYSLFVKAHLNSAYRPAGGHTREEIMVSTLKQKYSFGK